MKKHGVITRDSVYRYSLTRIWDTCKPVVCWIMLNPSTADAETDDPTIRRCISFSASWGYGGIVVVNLFAYRTTFPSELRKVACPVGKFNDFYINYHAIKSELVVCAWGNHGSYMDRSRKVLQSLSGATFLKRTNSGEPMHPLYLPKTCKPQKFPQYL